jgi:hypothetical protein
MADIAGMFISPESGLIFALSFLFIPFILKCNDANCPGFEFKKQYWILRFIKFA